MPKDYHEWKKRVELHEDPYFYVLHTFHEIVEQFISSPDSKAAKSVLDIAMKCVKQYLEEEDMRTFEHFPEGKICKICGTGVDKECTLIPIDGTNNDGNSEATPVHVQCMKEGNIRYNKEHNIFYILGYDKELKG